MRIDIEKHISQCISCAVTKGTTKTAPILEYPLPIGLFNVVGIDLLHLPRSIKGFLYVLVCIDHFSRFVVLAPYFFFFLFTATGAAQRHNKKRGKGSLAAAPKKEKVKEMVRIVINVESRGVLTFPF